MVRSFTRFAVAAAVVAATVAGVQGQAGQRRPQGQTPAPQANGPKKHLALVGGMLIDGYEVPPVHHAAILIEDDKIVQAGPASEVKIPADATVIDTSGRTMMPGLIEEHAHLSILGHGNYNRWYPWIMQNNYVEKVMEISAKQLLMAGITTAVDLGAPLKESISVRDRVKKGEIPGPHLLMSGPWVTRSLGSGLYPPEMNVMQKLVDTPEEAAKATEELIAGGVDVIKAYVQLAPAHYKAITDTAHKHRIRVHAHVYAEQDVRNALENGVDVLTHVGSAGTAPPYSKKMIEDIVNAGRPVVVTGAHRSWVFPDTVAFPERLQDPQLKIDFAPVPGLWEEVQNSLKNFQGLQYFARTDREMFFRERGVKQFIESGAIMGMGTDSGTPMNFHTEALWREIKAHVDMGMSPQRAIMSATRVNARSVLGLQDRGTIEPGKLADIIVVNGNPLFDIVALSHVEVVVKDGIVYKGGPAAKPARTSSSAQ
jgi:imidazolonepropionase-like amidohydrolase